MAQNRPGVSTYSRQQWQAIHPMFRHIYIDHGFSLEKAMMVLELINNFKTTANAFRNQIKRNWRDCAKNTRVACGNRTRPQSTETMFPDLPAYIAGLAVGSVPRSLSFQRFESHFQVLLSLDKYIKGYFDIPPPRLAQQDNSAEGDESSPEGAEKEQQPAIGGRWCRVLSLCQEISLLPQKKKDIIDFGSFPHSCNTNKAIKEEGIIRMKKIVTGIFKTKLFTKLQANKKESTPKDLTTLWSVCRVLRGLSFQLGFSKDSESLLMRLFLEELWKSFSQITDGFNAEMGRALGHFRTIQSQDLEDIARISCLCSARALSSRLGPHDPVVLGAWTDYYQHHDRSKLKKDVFLDQYEGAYEEAKAKLQTTKDKVDGEKALLFLINYNYVAYYICHNRPLAYQLSSELWEHTGAVLSKRDPPVAWSVEVQGMAEAAKIQGLLCYIKHENKLKSREDLKTNKIHKYNLISKQSRRRYRREVLQDRQKSLMVGYLPPYDPEAQAEFRLQEVVYKLISSPNQDFQLLATELHDLIATLLDTRTQAMENLKVAAWKLRTSNDEDCQLLAAGLYDQLASLICACSQDVDSVLQSVKSLFKKANDSPLTEIELSNLKEFLEKETLARRRKGRDCREKAKDLRRLVVAFDECVDFGLACPY